MGPVVPYKRRSAKFFQIHGPAAIEHSNLDWGNVAKFAEHLAMEDNVVRTCRENLVVWEAYLNAIAAAGDDEDIKSKNLKQFSLDKN